MPNLIEQIEVFLTRNGLSDSQFGVLAVKDKNLVRDLRAGRDVRMSTVERVNEFMATYRAEPKADAA